MCAVQFLRCVAHHLLDDLVSQNAVERRVWRVTAQVKEFKRDANSVSQHRVLLEVRQKLAPASSADDDTVAHRGKPIEVIILDSLAAYVARFTARSTLLRKAGRPRGDAIAGEVRHSRVG